MAKEEIMISTTKRVPDIRNQGERRGICGHCGWYEEVSHVKTDDTPGENGAGAARSTAKYRIIM